MQDNALAEAEGCLLTTLKTIAAAALPKEELPLLFVRIRTPLHMRKIYGAYKEVLPLLTGFVLPKFDSSNGGAYLAAIEEFNAEGNFLYVMPTLESSAVADLEERHSRLAEIKAVLDAHKRFVLNVRVGGNDFAHLFGLRRSVEQNIYQMGVIQNILIDILNVFSRDHVVSGPVWEYFGEDESEPWAKGLQRELELDVLNGFIGKTAIHPSQLPVIYRGLQVDRGDYEDAEAILHWDSERYGVQKSDSKHRMNEVKTHTKWAQRVYIMGQIYGVREDEKA